MDASNEDNYYEILGVSPNANQKVIELVFKQALNDYQDDSEDHKLKRASLENAYYFLGDEMRRYEYDHRRRIGKSNSDSDANNIHSLPPERKIVSSSKTYDISSQTTDTRNTSNRNILNKTQQHGEKESPSTITLIVLFVTIFIAGKALTSNTGSIIPSSSTPTINANNKPDQNLLSLALPPNGDIHYYQQAEAIAPFGIYTKPNVNYFVKLVDEDTGKTALTIFVQGGQNVEVKVPLGNYEFRYACGTNWYGEEHLFGSETVCMKADKIFDFYRNGSQIMGHNVNLIKQIDGNLHTSEINNTDF